MRRRMSILQRRRSVALVTEASGSNPTKGYPALLPFTLPDTRDERIHKGREGKVFAEQREVPNHPSLTLINYVNVNETQDSRYINVGPSTNVIGRGQFSSVYRMIDSTNGKLCAVKRINLRCASNKEQAGAELAFITNMKSRTLSHENIITFKSAFASPSKVSIVMEYASLGSLQDLIDSTGTSQLLSSSVDANYVLPIGWIAAIGKATFSGLHFLHSEQKCVHGDIKPSNILLFKNGQIKISDFGCCKALGREDDPAPTSEGSLSACGTLAFMSPEQLLGSGTVGAKSDVFSAGLTIMECIESSDQERSGETFWDVLDVIEMRTKAIVKRTDLPRVMRSFFQKCFAEEETRSAAEDLLKHMFLSNAKSSIENDGTLRSMLQFSSPLPRVRRDDMQLAVRQVEKHGQLDSAAISSMAEDLEHQLQPFAHDQQKRNRL